MRTETEIDGMTERTIAEILDRQEITHLLHQVARAIDRGDPALYADAFHPDGEDYHGIVNGHVSAITEVLGSIGR
jgi:hypothetical protein